MKTFDRYLAAAHAMQSGVAVEMTIPARQPATEPKHLRTAINSALADHAALAKLLISKGIITEDEYLEAITIEMEQEKTAYEQRISAHYGRKINLA